MRLLAVLLCLAAPMGAAAEDVQGDDDGWITLFDGSSLDAWRGYKKDKPTDGWSIEDGAIKNDTTGGDLITREQFGDFELTFEWKIAPGGNSGVIFRVTEDKNQTYQTGPEYQICDNAGWGIEAKNYHAAGALYELYVPSEEVDKPAGEWNEGKIRLVDGHITHWLNGKKVVDNDYQGENFQAALQASKFRTWKGFAGNDRGHIALQSHKGKDGAVAPVWYRNVKVRRLDKDSAAVDRPARVLFVTQSGGFRHSAVKRAAHELSHSERVMQQLGISSGEFRVDCTQDVEREFVPQVIEEYDVVMFFTTGAMFNQKKRLPIAQQTLDWFLNDWLKRPGKGFLGVHAAADTYADYEPYWDMIGGSFNGHPWNAKTTVAIAVHEPGHPAAQPWGGDFVITDEIYQFKNWQPEKVRVLMSLDMEKTKLKKPYHVPVLWVKQYGEGRVMHMSLGHREDVWSNPTYQQSLLGGIRWLMGRVPGASAPNPELSEAEERKARQAFELAQAA